MVSDWLNPPQSDRSRSSDEGSCCRFVALASTAYPMRGSSRQSYA